MNFKYHYDQAHQLINLKVGNFAVLWLHKEYSILLTVSIIKRLMEQYIKLFYVLERVGRLAYWLNISANNHIYNIFTIAQLEPIPNLASNLFWWPQSNYLDNVFVEKNTDSYKSFEIKHLINKHIIKWDDHKKVQYLIYWKRYGPEFDK